MASAGGGKLTTLKGGVPVVVPDAGGEFFAEAWNVFPVSELGVDLVAVGLGTHAEHAVLALQRDVHPLGDVVGDQRRDADAEVDVIAVAQLLRRPRRHLVAVPGHQF